MKRLGIGSDASALLRQPAGAERKGVRRASDVSAISLRATRRWLYSRAAAGLVLASAAWPVLRWYVLRLQDGSDEPFGLLALLAAVIFLPASSWRSPLSRRRLLGALSLMAGYAASYPWLPPLGHALLWLGALAAVLAPPAYALAWSTLLVLAMPIVSTVQFYFGYPMRCVTTQLAAVALRSAGLHVRASGTVLNWSGEHVLLDAPCAGIQMLWTLLLAAAVLASGRRLGNGATLRLFRWAALAVFVSNVARAVVLFCLEEHIGPTPFFGHDGVGLALFALAGVVLLWRAERESPRGAPPPNASPGTTDFAALRAGLRWGAVCFFLMVSVVVFSRWRHTAAGSSAEPAAFPGWTAAPIPQNLFPVALGARVSRFAKDFPGKIAAFTDGQRTWIVRWIEQPTRKLHPAADCLRGSGYAVIPGSAYAAADGTLWAGCRASREGKCLQVYERIFDPRGTGWTDVSAWYWHAILGRSAGPWWAVTRLQPTS